MQVKFGVCLSAAEVKKNLIFRKGPLKICSVIEIYRHKSKKAYKRNIEQCVLDVFFPLA